jgi:START domain
VEEVFAALRLGELGNGFFFVLFVLFALLMHGRIPISPAGSAAKTYDKGSLQSEVLLKSEPVQVELIQHKTLSAATSKRELVVLRGVREIAGTSRRVVWYTSPADQNAYHPLSSGFGRGDMLFHGIVVDGIDQGHCTVTLIQCLDLGEWIHERFFVEEVKKCGLRALKIRHIFFPNF